MNYELFRNFAHKYERMQEKMILLSLSVTASITVDSPIKSCAALIISPN